MTTYCLFVTMLAGALLPDISPADLAQVEETRIEGSWSVVAAIENGNPMPIEIAAQLEVVITEDQLEIHLSDQKMEKMEYTIKRATHPRQIDLKSDNMKNTVRGIFKIEKGQLIICGGTQGNAQRPNEFASTVDSRTSLITLERKK